MAEQSSVTVEPVEGGSGASGGAGVDASTNQSEGQSQQETQSPEQPTDTAQSGDAQAPAAGDGTAASGGSSSSSSDDALVRRLSEEMGRLLGESEGRITRSVGDSQRAVTEHMDAQGEATATVIGNSEGRVISTLTGEVASGNAVSLLRPDDALQYVPEGFGEYVGTYFTPFLWGIAAGFVAYLIGYAWEALMRLLGLARKR